MVSDEMNKMKPTIFKKQRPGLESRKRFEKYIFMRRSLINKLEKRNKKWKTSSSLYINIFNVRQ